MCSFPGEHTNMHRHTLINTLPSPCQALLCPCSSAWGGRTCRQSGPLRALSLHTNRCVRAHSRSCVWDTLWFCILMMKDRQPGSCLSAREQDPIGEHSFLILLLICFLFFLASSEGKSFKFYHLFYFKCQPVLIFFFDHSADLKWRVLVFFCFFFYGDEQRKMFTIQCNPSPMSVDFIASCFYMHGP